MSGRVLLIIAVASLVPGNSSATNLILRPAVGTSVAYDDNVNFSTSGDNGSFIYIVSPQVGIIASSESLRSSSLLKFTETSYSDSLRDTSLVSVNSDVDYLMERHRPGIGVSYSVRTTLDPESDDFGLTTNNLEKQVFRVAPRYSYQIDELTSIRAGITSTDVDYEENNQGLVDYTTIGSSLTLVHQLAETTGINATYSWLEYERSDGSSEYTLEQLQVGVNHSFSPTVNGSLSVGTSESRSESQGAAFTFFGTTVTPIDRSTNDGLILNVSLSARLTEVDRLNSSFSRSNTTNSFGGVDQVDSASLKYSRRLLPLWNMSLVIKDQQYEALSTGLASSGRSIQSFEAKLKHTISRRWSINGVYRHTNREFDSSSISSAGSNRVIIGLRYRHDDIFIE